MSMDKAFYDLQSEVSRLERGYSSPHTLDPYETMINAAAQLLVTAAYLNNRQTPPIQAANFFVRPVKIPQKQG